MCLRGCHSREWPVSGVFASVVGMSPKYRGLFSVWKNSRSIINRAMRILGACRRIRSGFERLVFRYALACNQQPMPPTTFLIFLLNFWGLFGYYNDNSFRGRNRFQYLATVIIIAFLSSPFALHSPLESSNGDMDAVETFCVPVWNRTCNAAIEDLEGVVRWMYMIDYSCGEREPLVLIWRLDESQNFDCIACSHHGTAAFGCFRGTMAISLQNKQQIHAGM